MKKNQKKKKKYAIIPTNASCPFKGPSDIDYKDVNTLKKYITTRGRILPTAKTGVCEKCQRKLSKSIKRARQMALIPYTQYV
jgi:small subunit ribosomal protein S18